MSGYGSWGPFYSSARTCLACTGKKHVDCDNKMRDLDLGMPDGSCDCPCWDGTETSLAALAESAQHHPFRAAISMRLAGRLHICRSLAVTR